MWAALQREQRLHGIVAAQQLFGQVLDVIVFSRRHLQVIALAVEVLQHHIDIFARQRPLGLSTRSNA